MGMKTAVILRATLTLTTYRAHQQVPAMANDQIIAINSCFILLFFFFFFFLIKDPFIFVFQQTKFPLAAEKRNFIKHHPSKTGLGVQQICPCSISLYLSMRKLYSVQKTGHKCHIIKYE